MVNKAELRQFITQYFSDLELDELCFDYYPDLLNQFTSGMTKSQKVIALIGYCDRRGLSNHLLTTLAKLRPTAYQDQFGLVPKTQTIAPAIGRNPNQIFLSHANQDVAFARQLADDLRQNGFDIWMAPESIEPGEKWVDAIERGLETSGIFVLVITPDAADSKWVRDESNYAIALQNKDEMRLFTLLVGEGRIPPMWSVRQHISFREEYDDGLRQLLAALRPDRFAARPAPPPAAAVAPPAAAAPPVEPTEAPPPAASQPPLRKPRAAATKKTKPEIPPASEGEAKPETATTKTTTTPEPAHKTDTTESLKPAQPLPASVSTEAQPAATPPMDRAPAPVVSNRAPASPIVAPDPAPESPAAKPPRSKPLYWAMGVVAVVAVAFLGWRLMASGAGGGNGNNGSGVTPFDVRTISRGGVEVEQVFVPAGSFMMGSEDGDEGEQAVHEVTLDAFWIDRTEVTNAQFAGCVADGACRPLADNSSYTRDAYYGNDEFADYPVINVSWSDARDFCEWTGARLPTEAEWEYAARGPEGFVFPWGNQAISCDLANYWGRGDICVGDTSLVGDYADGASWVGALDMAGNVWEWVNDWYDGGYYGNSPAENPTGPATGEYRVLRGGAWNSFDGLAARSYNRVNDLPDLRDYRLGFRCAQE